MKVFSTEQVTKYHPDKYADQISDAILDACLEQDQDSHVACECMVKNDVVVLGGEITTKATIDYSSVVEKVAHKLGYKANSVFTLITEQSPEISGGVRNGDDTGAGDQGMMFGYACSESDSMLPFGFDLANRIIKRIEEDKTGMFLGDAKTQVSVDLSKDRTMDSVTDIVISACHNKDVSVDKVRKHLRDLLDELDVPRNVVTHINPAGSWTLGGPYADCGLTGRKIVCDQYGGYCAVGGGAFSGKDPTKVDRSGAYMARKIACDMVNEFGVQNVVVQLSYGIGMKEPVGIHIDSSDKRSVDDMIGFVKRTYDLTPSGIIKALNLKAVKYEELAEGCHFRKVW